VSLSTLESYSPPYTSSLWCDLEEILTHVWPHRGRAPVTPPMAFRFIHLNPTMVRQASAPESDPAGSNRVSNGTPVPAATISSVMAFPDLTPLDALEAVLFDPPSKESTEVAAGAVGVAVCVLLRERMDSTAEERGGEGAATGSAGTISSSSAGAHDKDGAGRRRAFVAADEAGLRFVAGEATDKREGGAGDSKAAPVGARAGTEAAGVETEATVAIVDAADLIQSGKVGLESIAAVIGVAASGASNKADATAEDLDVRASTSATSSSWIIAVLLLRLAFRPTLAYAFPLLSLGWKGVTSARASPATVSAGDSAALEMAGIIPARSSTVIVGIEWCICVGGCYVTVPHIGPPVNILPAPRWMKFSTISPV
jgi:hypothetical protein